MSTHTFSSDMGHPEHISPRPGWVYGSSDNYGPHKVPTTFGDVFVNLGAPDTITVTSHEPFSREMNTLDGDRRLALRGLLAPMGEYWIEGDVYSTKFFGHASKTMQEKVLRIVREDVARWIETNAALVKAARIDAYREKARVIRDHADEAREEARREMERANRLENHADEAEEEAIRLVVGH